MLTTSPHWVSGPRRLRAGGVLNVVEGRWVEELCGTNVFSFDDGSFQTSPFTDMILFGIADDSLIVLVRDLG
jgi:branched-subunit amino acid aminotransferase/4-amino-4-deoxychorismate lyase